MLKILGVKNWDYFLLLYLLCLGNLSTWIFIDISYYGNLYNNRVLVFILYLGFIIGFMSGSITCFFIKKHCKYLVVLSSIYIINWLFTLVYHYIFYENIPYIIFVIAFAIRSIITGIIIAIFMIYMLNNIFPMLNMLPNIIYKIIFGIIVGIILQNYINNFKKICGIE